MSINGENSPQPSSVERLLIVEETSEGFARVRYVPPVPLTQIYATDAIFSNWIVEPIMGVHEGEPAYKAVVYKTPHYTKKDPSSKEVLADFTRQQMDVAAKTNRVPKASQGWMERMRKAGLAAQAKQ